MSAKTIHDLLPIEPGNSSPNAYEVFGLSVGEPDMAVVSAAVQDTVNRLRAVKSATDPQVWQLAAKVVQAARVKLADPKQKAELDAQFGIVQMPAAAPTGLPTPTPAKVDPLAGMLPPTNPLAPVQAPVTAPVVTTPVIPTPVILAPVMPADVVPARVVPAASTTAPIQPAAPVIRKNRPPTVRRRRPIVGTLMMTTFMLGTMALIGALIYFLLYGPGTLAITSQDGSLTIKTGPPVASNQPVVAPPRELEPPPAKPNLSFDPVMGKMAGDVSPPAVPSTSMMSPAIAPEPPPVQVASAEVAPVAEVSAPPMVNVEPISDAEAAAAIAKASEFIRAANWDSMKTVAEEVAAMPMSAEKIKVAEGLFQLADLATFYRGGIVRGVGTLTSGNDFEVTPDLRVVIVETGPDLLVVRANAQNKAFTLDQIPFVMSKKLAAFSIDAGPTREAAMAAYEAISPLGNEGYRDQALNVFERLSGQIEGADSDKLIAAMKFLYPSTN